MGLKVKGRRTWVEMMTFCTSPLKLALAFVENISVLDQTIVLSMFTSVEFTHSLPPVVRMPSFKVHFHLFLTRWTLSYVQSIT